MAPAEDMICQLYHKICPFGEYSVRKIIFRIPKKPFSMSNHLTDHFSRESIIGQHYELVGMALGIMMDAEESVSVFLKHPT